MFSTTLIVNTESIALFKNRQNTLPLKKKLSSIALLGPPRYCGCYLFSCIIPVPVLWVRLLQLPSAARSTSLWMPVANAIIGAPLKSMQAALVKQPFLSSLVESHCRPLDKRPCGCFFCGLWIDLNSHTRRYRCCGSTILLWRAWRSEYSYVPYLSREY